MAVQFEVSLENKPGSLARLTTVLGDADVNIEAIQGRSGKTDSVVHFITDKPEHAANVLSKAGLPFRQKDVVIVRVLDQPGMLGDVALVMASSPSTHCFSPASATSRSFIVESAWATTSLRKL